MIQVNKFWNRYLDQYGMAERSALSHSLILCHILYVYNDPGMLLPNHTVAVSKLTKRKPWEFRKKRIKMTFRTSRAVLNYLAFVNCHRNQWSFWWDEEAHSTNCKLIQYIREQNLIWSSVCQLQLGALLRMSSGSAASKRSPRIWEDLLFAVVIVST